MMVREKLRRLIAGSTKAAASHSRVEPLEGRTLLSAWSTVAAGTSMNSGNISSMTSDTAGNVYAVGYTSDSNPNDPGISMVLEKPAGGSWQQLTSLPGADAVAVDRQGNLFLTGQANNYFTTWELPNGSNTAVTIDVDSSGSGQGKGLTFDAAGNLYAVGYDAPISKSGSGYLHFLIRKGVYANGKWSFTSVDQLTSKLGSNYAYSVVTTANGVYVAGFNENTWVVRASATGAAGTWSTVDSFKLDSTSLSALSSARAITVDSKGRLYVAGTGQTTTEIPGSRPKAYHLTNWWIVRESDTGAAGTWSTKDNSEFWATPQAGSAWGIAHDAADNIYVAGSAFVQNGGEPGLVRVRSTASGTWSTSDVTPADDQYHTLTIDTFGNLYGGGEAYNAAGLDDYFIRSLPVAPTNLAAAPDAGASSSQIDLSWTNAAGSDETGFAIYRSSDGGKTFTLLTTVGAGVTTYSDSSLTAGTTYNYYVVTLLNWMALQLHPIPSPPPPRRETSVGFSGSGTSWLKSSDDRACLNTGSGSACFSTRPGHSRSRDENEPGRRPTPSRLVHRGVVMMLLQRFARLPTPANPAPIKVSQGEGNDHDCTAIFREDCCYLYYHIACTFCPR